MSRVTAAYNFTVPIEVVLAFISSAVAISSAVIATWQAVSAKRQVTAAELQVEYARAQAESARRQAEAAEEQVQLIIEQQVADRADSHAATLQGQASLVADLETISFELHRGLRSMINSIRPGGVAGYNGLVDDLNNAEDKYFACLHRLDAALHGSLPETFSQELAKAWAAHSDVKGVLNSAGLSWRGLVRRVAGKRSFALQRAEDFLEAMSRASAALPTDEPWGDAAEQPT